MTAKTLPEQEEHLFKVLSSQRFLRMEGLGNEVPFFIYPYEPELALEVADVKKRVKNKLTNVGVRVREINLYNLAVALIKERGDWADVIELETTVDKAEFGEVLRSMLNPEVHLAPAIRERLVDGAFDIFFLTGIGEVFPFIRSHNVLNNLQSVVTNRPMLMFFPGRYEFSPTHGSSLVLFGRLKDDQYYRAKNIIDQEA